MARRPIIRDPAVFGGEPHIEGTAHTIASLQAFWRRPGVGAETMRRQFPDLSEAELGAAVTWTEPRDPEFAFAAEHPGPPHCRYRLWSEPPGWMFACENVEAHGDDRAGYDVWEESWEAILRYLPAGLVWRDEKTGEPVDVHGLRFEPEAT